MNDSTMFPKEMPLLTENSEKRNQDDDEANQSLQQQFFQPVNKMIMKNAKKCFKKIVKKKSWSIISLLTAMAEAASPGLSLGSLR